MYKILDGVRIVDLTTVVLGPYATKVLADLGADVVKIEPLSGDQFRSVRPGHSDDLGAGFINLNINKRSIALNLATTEGREVLERLVKSCDVIVHNMRPKSAEKFDISYEKLKKINRISSTVTHRAMARMANTQISRLMTTSYRQRLGLRISTLAQLASRVFYRRL